MEKDDNDNELNYADWMAKLAAKKAAAPSTPSEFMPRTLPVDEQNGGLTIAEIRERNDQRAVAARASYDAGRISEAEMIEIVRHASVDSEHLLGEKG